LHGRLGGLLAQFHLAGVLFGSLDGHGGLGIFNLVGRQAQLGLAALGGQLVLLLLARQGQPGCRLSLKEKPKSAPGHPSALRLGREARPEQ
jgi:hypothetical protein